MKSIATLLLLAIAAFFWTASTASAQASDGWWFLEFKDTSGAALQPLNIGIDPGDGSGFSFLTLPDDDGDGVIHLPPVPNGGGLAMGADVDAEVGCDLWDLVGAQLTSSPGTMTVSHPLIIIAEDVEGRALGMGFIPFPQIPFPPIRALMPGERLMATDGQLADWPGLRLAIGPEPADLADFLRSFDTWPNFSGDVIVTNFLLTGTFVPEPASASILVALVGLLTLRRRRSTFGRRCSVYFRERKS